MNNHLEHIESKGEAFGHSRWKKSQRADTKKKYDTGEGKSYFLRSNGTVSSCLN